MSHTNTSLTDNFPKVISLKKMIVIIIIIIVTIIGKLWGQPISNADTSDEDSNDYCTKTVENQVITDSTSCRRLSNSKFFTWILDFYDNGTETTKNQTINDLSDVQVKLFLRIELYSKVCKDSYEISDVYKVEEYFENKINTVEESEEIKELSSIFASEEKFNFKETDY